MALKKREFTPESGNVDAYEHAFAHSWIHNVTCVGYAFPKIAI